MIYLEPGLYVRVQERAKGPQPMPLASGFSSNVVYRVLGMYCPSESGECWFVLSNDRDETWFIATRHFRTHGVFDLPEKPFRLEHRLR